MTPFDYKYQNPTAFACLMLIRAIVFLTVMGIQNLNKKRKTNWILVVVVKWRYRELPIGLCTSDKAQRDTIKMFPWQHSRFQPLSAINQLSGIVNRQVQADG